jgi:hypothetical protein
LLVSRCVGDRCDMADSDKNHGRSRKSGAKNQKWSSTGQVHSGQTIERLDDAVCDLHRTHRDDECEFIG